jgi:Flp pilus assembly pilin Flp
MRALTSTCAGLRRERGATTVEHALIVVGVALMAAAALSNYDLNTLFPAAVARVATLLGS